jgi:hypothetical protein
MMNTPTSINRKAIRLIPLVLVAAALFAATLSATPATGAVDVCSASGPIAVGWGGSRFGPEPFGVGPSCTITRTDLSRTVRLTVFGEGAIGGQVVSGQYRYFCRRTAQDLIGQSGYSVNCRSIPGGGIEMNVYDLLYANVYCSTTGEIGILVRIECNGR